MILRLHPIGEVSGATLETAAGSARDHFGFEVALGAAIVEPEAAWDPRRLQDNSVYFMRALAEQPREGAVRMLGLTERDLFIPALTFVFGQAQLAGELALVSVARLRQQFYGLPGDEELFESRTRKEIAHELGHTLGLIHCADASCAMSLSTTIYQVDGKHDRFCASCRHTIDGRIARLRQG